MCDREPAGDISIVLSGGGGCSGANQLVPGTGLEPVRGFPAGGGF